METSEKGRETAPASLRLVSCEDCGNSVSVRAAQCPSCGAPIKAEQVTTECTPIAHYFGIIGALGLILGPFLPWATAGVMLINASGFQMSLTDAVILCLLGIVALVPPMKSLSQRRNEGAFLSVLVGLIGGVISFSHYYRLTHDFLPSTSVPWAIGPGVFVCLVGAVLVCLNGLGARPSKPNMMNPQCPSEEDRNPPKGRVLGAIILIAVFGIIFSALFLG